MGIQVFADGNLIESREDAVEINGENMGKAYDRLVKFVQNGDIDGVGKNVDVKPIQGNSWDEPYEAFAPRSGTVKHVVADVSVHARDWVRIQADAHNSGSVQSAIEGATESTVVDIKNAIDSSDNRTLSGVPMPVLEIYMDGTCNHAEGRSRGVGVLKSSQDYIPIRVASRVYK